MRTLFGILTLVLVPVVGYAADNGLNWAYPVEPPPGNNADAAPPSKPVNQALIATTYTGLPRMPEVVAKGKPLPCMQYHLANGGSHPESAAISGLSVSYIIEQVHAFRDGERADVRTGPHGSSRQNHQREGPEGGGGIFCRDRARPAEMAKDDREQ